MTPNRDGLRVGPIWLEPGVSYGHFATFLYASLVTIGIVIFVNISQPYILVEKLGVLAGAEGALTGQLSMVSELTVMLSIGLVGIMADRIGRKQIFALGLILFGVSYLLYPTVETTIELFALRIVYALGVACATAMLGTVVNDYPQELSRGKLIAFSGVFLGIGALVSKLVIGGLPSNFIADGTDSTAAWTYTHWIVASICFISAVILAAGLKGGTPIRKEQRPSIKELFVRGFSEARKPRTAFAYASAFVARSDLVIIGTFTLLCASSCWTRRGTKPSGVFGPRGHVVWCEPIGRPYLDAGYGNNLGSLQPRGRTDLWILLRVCRLHMHVLCSRSIRQCLFAVFLDAWHWTNQLLLGLASAYRSGSTCGSAGRRDWCLRILWCIGHPLFHRAWRHAV